MKRMTKVLTVLMCLMTAVAFMPAWAFAGQTAEVQAAAKGSVKINYTISVAGALQVKDASIKVKDLNKNGTFDLYDAFAAIHKANKKTFAVSDGGWVTKFWSQETSNVSYMLDNNMEWSLDSVIHDGSYVYGAISEDTETYMDRYSYISDKDSNRTSSFNACDGVDLKLDVYKTMWEAFAIDENFDFDDTTVTVNGKDTNVKVNENGTFHVDFEKAGTYYISAYGDKESLQFLMPATYKAVATAAKGSIKVNYSIATKGNLNVKLASVKVTDVNKNGKFDIYDTLYKIHKAKGKKFAQNNGQIVKFWSMNTTVVGYMLNDNSAWSLDDTVQAGDYLYAFAYQDQALCSDLYSAIVDNAGKREVTVKRGEDVNLKLVVYGYGPAPDYAFGPVDYDYSTVAITTNGKSGNVAIGQDGSMTLKFAKKGTYYISAKVATGSGIITPAICKVTVKK